jgi:hypothetical protein
MSRATACCDSRPDPADHVGTRRPLLAFVGVLIAIVLTLLRDTDRHRRPILALRR